MLILTKAVPYSALPPEIGAFGRLKIGTLPVAAPAHRASAIGAALFVLYRYSTLGRQILAAGANPRAAAMSGVPVDRVIVISHALSGFLAACAALMVVARLGAAMPSVGGEEWLLPSFLGPVLGGTLLSGGVVAVVGTMIGAALVTTIRSGLLVLQIGNFWLQLFLGLILLFAVLVDRYRGVYRRAPHAEAAHDRCFAASLLVEWSGLAGRDRHRRRGARRARAELPHRVQHLRDAAQLLRRAARRLRADGDARRRPDEHRRRRARRPRRHLARRHDGGARRAADRSPCRSPS